MLVESMLSILAENMPKISVVGLTRLQIVELRVRRAQGARIKTLMQDYHLSKASVYRYLGATEGFRSVPHS